MLLSLSRSAHSAMVCWWMMRRKDPPGDDGIYRVFKSIEVETILLLICSLLTLMLIRVRRGDETRAWRWSGHEERCKRRSRRFALHFFRQRPRKAGRDGRQSISYIIKLPLQHVNKTVYCRRNRIHYHKEEEDGCLSNWEYLWTGQGTHNADISFEYSKWNIIAFLRLPGKKARRRGDEEEKQWKLIESN